MARNRVAAGVYGTLGGFTTMVANAAGPVMSMYFLAARFPVKEFLGTAAWFFAIVNVSKVPFSIGLGLITVPSLLLDLVLVPAVVVGVLLGVGFLAIADDAWVKRTIGVILLAVIAITLLRRRMGAQVAEDGPHRVAAATYGTIGGFTTMVANAAGPVMSMYFLAARFPVKEFLGTAAWFFAIVNIGKVPFSIGLGLITVPGLLVDLVLVPFVVGGALFGRWLAGRLNQVVFERLVITFTVIGALYLLL